MNDLLEIAVLPGKGRGYRAKVDIPVGATIHVSEPLATTVSQEWSPETCAYCFHFVYPKRLKIRAVSLTEQSLLLSQWNVSSKKNSLILKDMMFCSQQCKTLAIEHGYLTSDWNMTLAVHYRLDYEFQRRMNYNIPSLQRTKHGDWIEIDDDVALLAWLDHAWDCLTDDLDLYREIEDSDRSMCRLIAACILRKNSETKGTATPSATAATLPQYKDLLVIQNNELSLFKRLLKKPITKLAEYPLASMIPEQILDIMSLYTFFKRAMSLEVGNVPELENVNHQVFREIYFRERANSFGLWELEQDGDIAKGRGGVSDDLELLGFGIYPSAVYFNHACDANVIKVRQGKTIHFVARRMISQHEEACISYGTVEEDVYKRRERLLEHYHFICQCKTCVQEHLYTISR